MRFAGCRTESNYGHGQTLPNRLHRLRSLQATNTSAPAKHSDDLVAIPRGKMCEGNEEMKSKTSVVKVGYDMGK